MFMYVGTYTKAPQGTAEGIYVYQFDSESGTLDHIQTVTGIANPSFLAVDPKGRSVYAAGEGDQGEVVAYTRDARTGQLRELNRQSSHGASPCYVSVGPNGKYALVANYSSGTLAVLPINADGSLEPASDVVRRQGSGPNRQRQESAHAHMIAPSPDGRFVLATDLGADEIITYAIEPHATGYVARERSAAQATPGAGPRHFAFAPDGTRVYVINELDSTMTVFAYAAASGKLTPGQTISALPDGITGESWCAHIAVSPDGTFVYGSNRGHDSIAIWAVDPDSGNVTSAGHVPSGGKTPRNFTLDPSGTWLLVANQGSGTIVPFRRDPRTGMIDRAGEPIAVPAPVCLTLSD